MSQTKVKSPEQKKKEMEAYLESFRQTVVQEELFARMNKAAYEKMYYYVESEKLSPIFDEAVKQQQAKVKAKEEETQALFDKLQASASIEGQA